MYTPTGPANEKVLTFLTPEAIQHALTSMDEWTVQRVNISRSLCANGDSACPKTWPLG